MRIYVRPAAGLIVIGPDGLPLPAEGAFVDADSFWHRRLAKGEVARRTPRRGEVSDGDLVRPSS